MFRSVTKKVLCGAAFVHSCPQYDNDNTGEAGASKVAESAELLHTSPKSQADRMLN